MNSITKISSTGFFAGTSPSPGHTSRFSPHTTLGIIFYTSEGSIRSWAGYRTRITWALLRSRKDWSLLPKKIKWRSLRADSRPGSTGMSGMIPSPMKLSCPGMSRITRWTLTGAKRSSWRYFWPTIRPSIWGMMKSWEIMSMGGCLSRFRIWRSKGTNKKVPVMSNVQRRI